MVIWLERRPSAFLIADSARPAISLAALSAFLAAGEGLAGAQSERLITIWSGSTVTSTRRLPSQFSL
jgi:hypothetical protein